MTAWTDPSASLDAVNATATFGGAPSSVDALYEVEGMPARYLRAVLNNLVSGDTTATALVVSRE